MYLLLTVRLSIILVFNLFNAENIFIIILLCYCTCLEHYVLVIGKSKLYYTASDIVTLLDSRPVHSPLSIIAPDGHIYF